MIKQFKKRIMIVIALVLLAIAFALNMTLSKRGGDSQNPTTFLWDIEYKGEHIASLFGTAHAGSPTSQIPPAAIQRLDKSDVLVSEVKVLFPTEKAKLVHDIAAIQEVYPEVDQPISERISGQLLVDTENFYQQRGIPLAVYNYQNLDIIFFQVTYGLMQGESPEFGMEALISHHLKGRDIKNIALEGNVESLLLIKEAMGNGLAEVFLAEIFEDEAGYQAISNGILKAYEENDVPRLMALSDEEMAQSIANAPPEYVAQAEYFKRTLLEKRNHDWVEVMTPLLKNRGDSEQFFIAVGALHLFGKEGLLQLLESEDFTVKPVNY